MTGKWQLIGTRKYINSIEKGYSKGSTQGEDEKSDSKETYPENGEQGGIWYI